VSSLFVGLVRISKKLIYEQSLLLSDGEVNLGSATVVHPCVGRLRSTEQQLAKRQGKPFTNLSEARKEMFANVSGRVHIDAEK